MPSNKSWTLLASAARTATTTVVPETQNTTWRGMLLSVDATVIAATETITPSVQALDENGDYVAIWTATTAISAAGNYTYLLYPGASGGNVTEVDGIAVPLEWQLSVAHSSTGSHTYSVRCHYIL